MTVFSSRLYSRANQFRRIFYFWRNADFHNNGLSSNFVAFQYSKKFSSSQEEKFCVKESLVVNQFDKINDLPNNEFQGKLLGVLQNVEINSGNPSASLHKVTRNLLRKNFSNDEIENVKNHPFFNNLCKKLEKTLVICTPQELYFIFKFASFFQLPESSLFVKKLFVLILDKINLMSHLQLLNILLKIKMHTGKTAEGLKTAILACLEHKQPVEDLKLDTACFYFSRTIIPECTKKLMMQFIAGHCNHDWTPLNWVNVIEGLKNYTVTDENTEVVVKKIRNYLSYSLNENWSTKHLLNVYYSLFKIQLHNCKSENLLDTLSYYLSQKNLSELETCRILYILTINNHFNHSLYKKFCEKVKEKDFIQKLKGNPQNFAFKTLIIFSKLNFLGLDEETIANLKECLGNMTSSDIDLSRGLIHVTWTLIHFLSINIYDKNIVNVFYDLLITDIDQISKTSLKERYIILLHHYLSIFHPEDKPSLPDDVVEKLKNLEIGSLNSSELKSKVESMFGGEKYVVGECFTPEGIYFDYAVALTADNTPMDLSHVLSSSGPVAIDPKSFPEDAKLIFIQICNSKAFIKFSNASIESIWKRISDKIYKKLNYNVFFLQSNSVDTALYAECFQIFITKAFEEQFGKIQRVIQ